MSEELFYLIYRSEEATKMSIEAVQELTNLAAKRNKKENITGLLIREANGFTQYLEGNKRALMMIFESILNDKRHHSIKVLARGFIEERKFGKWSMLLKHVSAEEIETIEFNLNQNKKTVKRPAQISNSHLALVLDLIKGFQYSN